MNLESIGHELIYSGKIQNEGEALERQWQSLRESLDELFTLAGEHVLIYSSARNKKDRVIEKINLGSASDVFLGPGSLIAKIADRSDPVSFLDENHIRISVDFVPAGDTKKHYKDLTQEVFEPYVICVKGNWDEKSLKRAVEHTSNIHNYAESVQMLKEAMTNPELNPQFAVLQNQT